LQGLTFYDYVEHFLIKAVILEGDCVGNEFLECFRLGEVDMAEGCFYENL
jgi:hypothetical protein